MRKLKITLYSILIFLLGLKVIDLALWAFSSDEPADFQITETKMLREHIAEEVAQAGMEYEILKNELLEVYYKQFSYHPYRWYALPAQFEGIYVQTDRLGFRNKDIQTPLPPYTIGLFGGSTMFGLYNSQAQTIPAMLQKRMPDSVRIINYGIGGYSSTTELMTLIEVIRHTRLDEVIFYDGVNELVMLLDGLNAKDFSFPTFQVMGHYFSDTRIAMRNSFDLDQNFDKDDPLFYKTVYSIYPDLTRSTRHVFFPGSTEGFHITAENVALFAQQIIRIYLHNIEQIRQICKANGIKAHFVWQPHIMNTRKSLTQEEAGIHNLDKNKELRMLAEEVESSIKELLPEHNILSFAEAFDREQGGIFLDWCHINETGNQLIADHLLQILKI